MKPNAAVVKQSYLSVLGAFGSGAAGGVVTNNLSQLNAAPLAPAADVHWDSSAFVSRTGRVLVTATMNLSKNGGTLAAGDLVTFTLVRDIGGTPITIGGPARPPAAAVAGGDVTSFVSLTFIDTVTAGVSHTWSINAQISGGHTGGVLVGEATVTLIDV